MQIKNNVIIRKVVLCACFLLSTAFSFSSCYAVGTEDELVTKLGDIKSMRADFDQFMLNGKDQQIGDKATGKMALVRPGKFRYETTSPMQQLIVANQDFFWIYDADLKQATKKKIDYSQPGNPALLLSGSTQTIQKIFKITKLSPRAGEEGEWFILKPKSKNNMYRFVKLHFVNDQLVAMYISDNLGQQSEIDFKNIEINQELPANLFEFTPPQGTDVIESN